MCEIHSHLSICRREQDITLLAMSTSLISSGIRERGQL